MARTALQPIANNVWTVEHDLFTFGVHFPGRMTVIRLSTGGLWLHSPVPIDDALAAELQALGPVEHLVGPNKFHHLHLRKAKARYPDAKLWAAPGLDKKRSDLAFDEVLGTETPSEWQADLQLISFACMPAVSEVVFFHEPSATLIVTDLLMNVHECQGLISKFIYWAEGVSKRLAVPRLNCLLVKDRAAAAAAAARLVAFEPSVVIMAHGRVVHEQAGNELARALQVLKPTQALAAGSSA